MPGEVQESNPGSDPGRRNRPPLAFSTSGRAQVRAATASSAPDMPGRPYVDELPPPAVPTPVQLPRMLTVCIIAWIASFVVGLGAIAMTLVHGDKVRSQLTTKVHQLRPSLNLDEQKHVAAAMLNASAIAGAVLILLQLWFVHRLRARRRKTRIALSVLGIANIALLLLFEDALSPAGPLSKSSERLNALGHAAMIAIAMVTTYWRSIGRWLRREPVADPTEDG